MTDDRRTPWDLAGLGLALLLCAVLGWCSQAGAGEPVLSCPVTVGPVAVVAVVWYDHEAEPHGGTTYTYTPAWVVGPGTADLDTVEGYPVAVEWWAGQTLIKRCGTRPDRIMWDDFEAGDTARWRTP